MTKYSAIQGNITRGFAECNISRYWTRKASRVKYPANPEVRQPIPRAKGPRDWLNILRGMLSEFNIEGNSVNIASFSVLTGTYYMYYLYSGNNEHFEATFIKYLRTNLSLLNLLLIQRIRWIYLN